MSRLPAADRLLLPALFALCASGCFLDRSVQGASPATPDDGGGPGVDAQVIVPDGGQEPDGGHDGGLDGGRETDGGPQPDRDGDGVPDALDVCPDVPDPAQADLDGDGIGDACDDDRDGDGIVDALDLCPERDSHGAPDEDGDGILDECDLCPLDPDPTQPNGDGDRLGDACEDADPTRFSRVAYLATFATSLDGLQSGTGVTVSDGAAHIDVTSSQSYLWHPQSADFPDDYALDVRAAYPGGDTGSVAALIRGEGHTSPSTGYALGLLASSDGYGIVRSDLCGGFPCQTVLTGMAGLGLSPGAPIRIRATAFGSALALELAVGSAPVTTGAIDHTYATGGVGLVVLGAKVRVDAMAVYAP